MAKNVSLSEYLGLFVVSNVAVLDQVQLQCIAINRININQWRYQKMLKMLLKIKHLSLSLSFLTFLLSENRNCLCILDHPLNFSFGLGGATNVAQGHSFKQMILKWNHNTRNTYIGREVKKATQWELKCRCQWYGSIRKDMSTTSRATKTKKRNTLIFLHSSSQKFQCALFSLLAIFGFSCWLYVWVASLCYFHPTFFKLTWELSYNLSRPYFNEKCSFLFHAPVLKGPLLGRTIKLTRP